MFQWVPAIPHLIIVWVLGYVAQLIGLISWFAILFTGKLPNGLAGAQMSLVYTSQWIENMTAGRGWIALALVVFASWRPTRVLLGAYLFGAITIAQLHVQALSPNDIAVGAGPLWFLSEGGRWLLSVLKSVPAQFLSALPYLATVVVLVLISRNRRLTLINTPACLGRPFVPDR